MDPTSRRPLGRNKLSVTALGFGAAPIGGFRATIPEIQAIETVAAAQQGGVNFFDTSPFYGYGRSELRVGAALRHLPRDSLVLSSKIGRWMRPIRPGEKIEGLRPHGLSFAPVFDYSYDGVRRSLEQSLLRLGMDRIDILFIHDVDFWTIGDRDVLEQRFKDTMNGAHRALAELRADGTIGAFGVGLNEADMSARFVRAGDFDCVLLAGRYTLLEQGALDDFLPLCEERGVSVVLGGPFNSGILAVGGKPGAKYDYQDAPPAILERARKIETICRRHGVALPAAALQFPLAHPAICSVIPGALSPQEVRDNLGHMRAPIPAALWAELRHEDLLDLRAPIPTGR